MIIDVSHMCCPRFADFLCNRRKRGMAIIPVVAPQVPLSFLLCFRALSAEDSGQIIDTGAVKVQTACMVGIRHCPWCGANLRTFYSHCVHKLPTITIGEDAELNPDELFTLVDDSDEVCQFSENNEV